MLGGFLRLLGRKPAAVNGSEKEEDEARQDYLAYYRLLMDQQFAVTQSFDKAMLTLSGGALGLSMVFIREVAPSPKEMGWIGGAWLLFGLSLLCMVLSFRSSKLMLQYRRQAAGQEYQGEDADSRWKKWDGKTMWLNRLSIVFFFLGAILFGVFALRNVR